MSRSAHHQSLRGLQLEGASYPEQDETKETKEASPDSTWFFGAISREQAELILRKIPPETKGAFLVRSGARGGGLFALSIGKHPSLQARKSEQTQQSQQSQQTLSRTEVKLSHTLVKAVEVGNGAQTYVQLQDSARLYKDITDLVQRAPELRGLVPAGLLQGSNSKSDHVHSVPSSASTNNTGKQDTGKQSAKEESTGEDSEEVRRWREIENSALAAATASSGAIDVDALESALAKHNTTLARLKQMLGELLQEQERRVQVFDESLVARSMDEGAVSMSDSDHAAYLIATENVHAVFTRLQNLRLHGDSFRVWHKNELKLFRITEDGQIMFCHVTRTLTPESVVPEDMSQFLYFNVGVVQPEQGSSLAAAAAAAQGGPVYEITCAKTVHHIDMLQQIEANDRLFKNRGDGRGGIVIHWRNGKKTSCAVVLSPERAELIATVDAHRRRYLQAAQRQIQLLKDIWRCKSTRYNSEVNEHAVLLRRLWDVLVPSEPCGGLTGNHWKHLGFQGSDPSSDFRGMGLLGLLNLIFFAERHTAQAQRLIEGDRDYPVAACGINITSMLLNLLGLTSDLVQTPASSASWFTPVLSLFYYADNDDTFDELYSHTFILFDRLWLHMEASYMDFPHVISKLQEVLEECLRRKPLSMEQLVTWIDQVETSHR